MSLLGASACSPGIASDGAGLAPVPAEQEPAQGPAAEKCARRLEVLGEHGCELVEVREVASREVRFDRDGFMLNGTLTFPVTDSGYRAPTVVIVHGSGPGGRDGWVGGALGISFGFDIPVYRSLAEQLASVGVATLRYDKRSCFRENNGHCTHSWQDYPGDIDALLIDDFAADARAALRFASTQPEVRANDVLLAGHSQGGSFVARLVAEEEGVSGGIGLAAPALGLLESVAGQLRVFADFLEAQDAKRYAADIAELRSRADKTELELGQVLDGNYPEPRYQGVPVAFWQSWDGWMQGVERDYKTVDKDILMLAGDLDFNIWPEHLETFERWGSESGLGRIDTVLLPELTHAFVDVVLGGGAASGKIGKGFSPAAIDEIVSWLDSHRP